MVTVAGTDHCSENQMNVKRLHWSLTALLLWHVEEASCGTFGSINLCRSICLQSDYFKESFKPDGADKAAVK